MKIIKDKRYGRFSCVYKNDLFVYPPFTVERFVLRYFGWFFTKIAWDDIGFRNYYFSCVKKVRWRLKPRLERNHRQWHHPKFYWEQSKEARHARS